MSKASKSDTEYVVNCRECSFVSYQPDFQNADRVRDGHELEMFNWRGDEDSCGPCAIGRMRSTNTGESNE